MGFFQDKSALKMQYYLLFQKISYKMFSQNLLLVPFAPSLEDDSNVYYKTFEGTMMKSLQLTNFLNAAETEIFSKTAHYLLYVLTF